MTKRKNPAFKYGETPKEITDKLLKKALDFDAGGETNVEEFLNASETGATLAVGVQQALDLYRIKDAAAEDARSARKHHADAWKRDFDVQARERWDGQSEASHWTIKQMAAELRECWKKEHGKDPCGQSTAEKFLSPIHADIWRRLGRSKG
jgi:hypothetical protein